MFEKSVTSPVEVKLMLSIAEYPNMLFMVVTR